MVTGEGEPFPKVGYRTKRRLICECDCGGTRIVEASIFQKGCATSCGCLRRERKTTHGRSGDPTWRSWWSMICRGRGTSAKEHYQDRGIRVCKRWHKFENFLSDMGERPAGHSRISIDRIDNSGSYCPENCRWATSAQQARNKRGVRLLSLEGKTQCVRDWAKEYGIDKGTLAARLRNGMPLADALRTRVKRRYYTINGERMSGKSVWLKYGRPDLSYGVFLQRVGKGWSLYDALQRQLNSHNPLTQQEPW